MHGSLVGSLKQWYRYVEFYCLWLISLSLSLSIHINTMGYIRMMLLVAYLLNVFHGDAIPPATVQFY